MRGLMYLDFKIFESFSHYNSHELILRTNYLRYCLGASKIVNALRILSTIFKIKTLIIKSLN